MSVSALRRLMSEYKQLTLNPPEGILAGPINEENFFEWEALISGEFVLDCFYCFYSYWICLIVGPDDTPYENGVFKARLTFPTDYPLSPPDMRFVSEMYHPNVYPDGRVCISILHPPGADPMGYETVAERWSPVQSIEKVLLSVVSMLAEPNIESGANVDAAKMYRDDIEQYKKIAKECVRKSLDL